MFSGKVVHLPLKEFSDSNAMQNAENRTVAKTLPLFLQYYAKATNIQIVEINQPLFKINDKAMNIKILLIMGVIGGLCACSEKKGYFSPNEIPILTSEFEELSEKEMARIPSYESTIDTLLFVIEIKTVCISDTLPDGTIKEYTANEEKIICKREFLVQHPYFYINKSFDRLTGKLLSKEVIAPGYITVGTSYHYDKTGKLKEKKQEEKGYKFRINQLLKLLNDKGIVIPKLNPIGVDYDFITPDTTYIGFLKTIDRKAINGKPCYVVFYYLFKEIKIIGTSTSIVGRTLEIDGTKGTILKEEEYKVELFDYCE